MTLFIEDTQLGKPIFPEVLLLIHLHYLQSYGGRALEDLQYMYIYSNRHQIISKTNATNSHVHIMQHKCHT